MAVMEKRFQAHQEAHSFWTIVWRSIDIVDDAIDISELLKCLDSAQDWWTANSLYLDPEARKAVQAAMRAAGQIGMIVTTEESGESADFKATQKQLPALKETVRRAGGILEQAVCLPPLAELKETVSALPDDHHGPFASLRR